MYCAGAPFCKCAALHALHTLHLNCILTAVAAHLSLSLSLEVFNVPRTPHCQKKKRKKSKHTIYIHVNSCILDLFVNCTLLLWALLTFFKQKKMVFFFLLQRDITFSSMPFVFHLLLSFRRILFQIPKCN